MLSRKLRIPKALAREVFMVGQSVSSNHFFLKTLPSRDPGSPSQFAVSISKKVAPTAVLRNRTRRRFYSALRDFVPQIRSGFLVGFVVKSGGQALEYGDIVTELKSALSRSRLLV